jgi:hypothetical protein
LKIVVTEFCVTVKTMIRRWVQILALVTMAVSVVNAQCAMSCSLLSMVASSPDHSCCPHHRSPDRQAPGNPCDKTVAHADAARLEFDGAAVSIVVPVAATVASLPDFLSPLTWHSYADRFRAPDSSGPAAGSVSILRI